MLDERPKGREDARGYSGVELSDEVVHVSAVCGVDTVMCTVIPARLGGDVLLILSWSRGSAVPTSAGVDCGDLYHVPGGVHGSWCRCRP